MVKKTDETLNFSVFYGHQWAKMNKGDMITALNKFDNLQDPADKDLIKGDFNFVEDTCNAFKAVAESELSIGKVINSANNFEISIKETAKMIAEIMNQEIDIVSDEIRLRPKNSEVNRLYGDNNLLKKITDWEPNFSGISGLKKGLELTVDWFSKKENLDFYKTNLYSI